MDVKVAELPRSSDRLVPLIARPAPALAARWSPAGWQCFLHPVRRPSRSHWQALAIAGVCGFSTAVGIHFVIATRTSPRRARR
jgi:hypothetical protein